MSIPLRYTIYVGNSTITELYAADTSALVDFAFWLKSEGKRDTWAFINVYDGVYSRMTTLADIMKAISGS